MKAPSDLLDRTKAFALRVIRLVNSLDRSLAAEVMGRQLLRSATSVGANYRAACRARSRAEFVARLGVAEEEADESLYWLELLGTSGIIETHRIQDLIEEANELVAIIVASIRTARRGRGAPNRP
jgi:four helix bundle protein